MAIVGGNLERKEIGLTIGVSGTHRNTEIDEVTGHLRLAQVDADGSGNPIYAEEGTWISKVINLEDKFLDFEKVVTTHTINDASSFTISTRTSDNSMDWSEWTAIAADGTIQSDTKQYIQVKIDLFAGFVTDVFIISNSDFEINEFVEEKEVKAGGYIVPKLTSNTSSSEGFAFSETVYGSTYEAWYAFDKADRNQGGYITKSGVIEGILGFCFNSGKRVTKYKIRSMAGGTILTSMPKNWVFQGSNDTTNGINGSWYDLDKQTNQIWATAFTDKIFEISNKSRYRAFRIKWSENNGHVTYTGVGELDFYEEGTTTLNLKRDYSYDKERDLTWSDVGSLHKKKITRDEWVRIDKLEVVKK